jgi:glutaredoxin-like YruB-family protein
MKRGKLKKKKNVLKKLKKFIKKYGGIMNKKVIVYSTRTCPYCRMLKDFLKENNIIFEDYDVGENREKLEEMIKKSGQIGVPVVDIDGEIIVGFDREEIKRKLGL